MPTLSDQVEIDALINTTERILTQLRKCRESKDAYFPTITAVKFGIDFGKVHGARIERKRIKQQLGL